MRRWYVVQVKNNQEQLAIDNLQNQNFKVWHPVLLVTRVIRGQAVAQLVPLFAGYMFVRFDINKDQWRRVGNTKGVYKLLTATEEKCTALPKGFVEQLRKQADRRGVLRPEPVVEVVKDWVIGMHVSVLEGVFKGFDGKIQSVSKNSVVVLLSLLKRQSSVELPKISVSHCASHEASVR